MTERFLFSLFWRRGVLWESSGRLNTRPNICVLAAAEEHASYMSRAQTQSAKAAAAALLMCSSCYASRTQAISLLIDLHPVQRWTDTNIHLESRKGQLTLFNFPKKASTRQKLIVFLFLEDLFTSSTSTWAGLTAKLLLKGCRLLCRVEECEARAVSNIISVSSLCLFCVSKRVVSTAECGDMHEGKGEELLTDTDRFKRMIMVSSESTRKREGRVAVYWRSADFTFGSVVFSCSIGIQNHNEKPENEDNSSPLNLESVQYICEQLSEYSFGVIK